MTRVTLKSEAGAARVDLFKRETRRDPVWLTAPARRVLQRESALAQMLDQGRSPRTELLAAGLWNLPVVNHEPQPPRVDTSIIIDLQADARCFIVALALATGQQGLLHQRLTYDSSSPAVFIPDFSLGLSRPQLYTNFGLWWQGQGPLPLPSSFPVWGSKKNPHIQFAWNPGGKPSQVRLRNTLLRSADGQRVNVNVFPEEYRDERGRINRLCHLAFCLLGEGIVSDGMVYLVHKGKVLGSLTRLKRLKVPAENSWPAYQSRALKEYLLGNRDELAEGIFQARVQGGKLILARLEGRKIFIALGLEEQRCLLEFKKVSGGNIKVYVYDLEKRLLKVAILRQRGRTYYGRLPERTTC